MDKNDETLFQTIRARLEMVEGKAKWNADPKGPWNIIPPTNTGLIGYFEAAYQPGIDPYGQPTNNEPLGTIHIRKRRTGATAAMKEAERMAKYYGANLIKETREPWLDHYNREIGLKPFFQPVYSKPSRWQRFTYWIRGLFTKKGKR